MAILAIAAEVGKPISVDDFTDLLKEMRYAHVRVEKNAGKPLKRGVLIWGKEAF